jgi:hypothetical protein
MKLDHGQYSLLGMRVITLSISGLAMNKPVYYLLTGRQLTLMMVSGDSSYQRTQRLAHALSLRSKDGPIHSTLMMKKLEHLFQ